LPREFSYRQVRDALYMIPLIIFPLVFILLIVRKMSAFKAKMILVCFLAPLAIQIVYLQLPEGFRSSMSNPFILFVIVHSIILLTLTSILAKHSVKLTKIVGYIFLYFINTIIALPILVMYIFAIAGS